MIPGEYFLSEDPIIANIGKSVIILDVKILVIDQFKLVLMHIFLKSIRH